MKLLNSFKYAIAGFWHCVKHERNFRIHLIAAAAVIALAVILDLPRYEVMILILAIGLVLLAEMINTAVERVVDAITECSANTESDKLDGLRKIAKDVAAGAVLVSAIFAAIVGVIIFGGRLFNGKL